MLDSAPTIERTDTSLTPPDRNHVPLSAHLRAHPKFAIEAWRPVIGATGYEVSNLGAVRSLDRKVLHAGGLRYCRGRRLRPIKEPNGYLRVSIAGVKMYIHHLVCDAFHGPCPPGMERRHLDGCKSCNWACNLAYGTPAENCADTKRHGRAVLGDRHPFARLTTRDVAWARKRAAEGRDLTSLARALEVPATTLRKAIVGQTWKHCPVPASGVSTRGQRHKTPAPCAPSSQRLEGAPST